MTRLLRALDAQAITDVLTGLHADAEADRVKSGRDYVSLAHAVGRLEAYDDALALVKAMHDAAMKEDSDG